MGAERGLVRVPTCPIEGAQGPTRGEVCFPGELCQRLTPACLCERPAIDLFKPCLTVLLKTEVVHHIQTVWNEVFTGTNVRGCINTMYSGTHTVLVSHSN